MQGISTNPLGRTQQKGQGTAFVYKPLSNVNPLDRLYNTVLQQQQNKIKQKIEGDKIRIEAGKDLRNQTLKVFDKLRAADIPLAQQYINELFEEVNSHPNFSDPMSPDFQKAQEKLAQLNVFANSSEALKKSEDDASNKWNTRSDEFDPKSKELLDLLKTKTTLEVASDTTLQSYLTLNPRKLSLEEALNESKIMSEFQKTMNYYKPLVNDKNLKDNINKEIDEVIVPNALLNVYSHLQGMRNSGRIDPNITDTELQNFAQQTIDANKKSIFYDPTKDQDQALAKQKEANLDAYRKKQLKIAQQRANAYEKNVDFATSIQDFGSNEFVDLLYGLGNEQKFFNEFYSSASSLGIRDYVEIKKVTGTNNLKFVIPILDTNGNVVKDGSKVKTKTIIVNRNSKGEFSKEELLNSEIVKIYERSIVKSHTSVTGDTEDGKNPNTTAGVKKTKSSTNVSSNSNSSKTTNPTTPPSGNNNANSRVDLNKFYK